MEFFLLIVGVFIALVVIGKLKGEPDIEKLDVGGLKREIWVTQNWINNYNNGGCPPKYQEKFQHKLSRLEQANSQLGKLTLGQTTKSSTATNDKPKDVGQATPKAMPDDENSQDFLILESIRHLTDLALSKGKIKSQEEAHNYCKMFKNRIRNIHLSGKPATLDEVKSAIEKELAPVFQYSLDFLYKDMGLRDPEGSALAFSMVAWYEYSKLLAQAQNHLTEDQLTKQKIEVSLSNAKRALNAGNSEDEFWYLTEAARLGDAGAQNRLGEMHYRGYGATVFRKPLVSLKWWRLAAEQDFAKAQSNIGNVYRDGEVVTKDDKEAAKWYLMAAEHGDYEAQSMLASMYEKGEGVPKDYVQSLKWSIISGSDIFINSVSRIMTADQIAEAHELARKQTANNFKGC